jgi:hypothetical protein
MQTLMLNRESEHQSDKDQRMHYTGFQLDKDGNVIAVSHYVKSRQVEDR